jgi:hypothetical protein
MQGLQDIGTRPAAVAAAAVLCAAAWIALNAAGNYGGQISGLFYTGAARPLPPSVASHTRRAADESGYDGQFYHLVAHDPLIRLGYDAFVDNPPLRWRRIGVPGLAAFLSAGNTQVVDAAYLAIQLGFVFAGAYWLERYARQERRRTFWGLLFLLIPAVIVSLERMTIDLPLAALTVGLVLFGSGRPNWPVYPILCAATLVRETGLVLVIAYCLYSVSRRDWWAAVLAGICAAPAIAWWAYVARYTAPDGTNWLSRYPFSGLIERTISRVHVPAATLWLRAASAFEWLALAGIWLAVGLCGYLAWKRRHGLLEVTAVAFAAFASTLGKYDIWESAYAAGRTMSPLLIVLGMLALRDRRKVFAAPLLLILPRLALQFEAQLKGALRGLI